MSVYAQEHADALADVTAAGSAVTFSHTAGTYTESTDTTSGAVTTTYPGAALRTKGDPITYGRLGLVQSEAPTLLFVPTTQGQLPPLNASVTWNSVVYTVRDVDTLGPDGSAILGKVVISR